MAAQEQAIRTNKIKAKIDETQENSNVECVEKLKRV